MEEVRSYSSNSLPENSSPHTFSLTFGKGMGDFYIGKYSERLTPDNSPTTSGKKMFTNERKYVMI